MGRTSHELEGHGHALLIVRHVCGISRGVCWSGGGGAGGGVAAGWSACWSMRSISRGRRRRRKPPRRKPLRTCQAKLRAGELRLQQSRRAHAIPLKPQISSPPFHSTHNAVHPCLQHAQAARHARLPPPAAREGPAPPVLSQDEVSRSCMYAENSLPGPMLTPSQKEEHSG